MAELTDLVTARNLVRSHIRSCGTERQNLIHALGRIIAETVIGEDDAPPFDKALVDGYALQANDINSKRESRFSVVETVYAGQPPHFPVAAGQASLIMTGAPVPLGADAIVMREHTQADADTVHVELDHVVVGQNIMKRGAAHAVGRAIVEAGQLIRPVEVGVLAESGRTEVKVYTQPTVMLLQTGDEVVETGAKLKPGQIRNSNGPMLSALVSQAGGKPVSSCLVGDNVEDLKRSVHEGLQQDLLLISGGVSVGDKDFVPQVLSSLGVNQVFHKVNFRPGKPLWFGTYERCLVFGLPGNPISGLVSFLLFVAPAIATLVGHRCAWESWEQMATASLEEPFQLKGERPAFWPGVRSIDGRTVRALPWRGSADPYTLVKANCLISFPIGNCQYTVDEDVAVIALR